jgi:hypothetical protein
MCRRIIFGDKPEKPDPSPPPYPTPVRGTTLGRDCSTCGLAPPRPSIPPGVPAPPIPPIGIGIIGMPPADAPKAVVALGISPPNPDITELSIPAGTDPDHVGGTDIAPTSRALPKPADVTGPSPPAPPPSGVSAGAVLPTNFGTSAPTAAALANPAVPVFAPCANDISGDISVLTGDAAIWANDVNEFTGTDEATDCSAISTAGIPETTPMAGVDCAAKPAKSAGGALNGVSVDATDVAPA